MIAGLVVRFTCKRSHPLTEPSIGLLVWVAFFALILSFLALDLGVLNRKDHAPKIPEALAWSALWIGLALAFNAVVYFLYENNWIGAGLAFPTEIEGRRAALEFFTGYVLEKSLSLDNVFVIALIFSYFRVPLRLQHRVLFWGILGALIMRGVMIGAGAALVTRFGWITYVFGVLLLFTAARMLFARHDNLEPEKSPLVRLTRRFFPVTDGFRNGRFVVKEDGRRFVTPLLLVLLLVESTDVLFAVDSIPAVFAVTTDPFLVYTSNVFAILGMRSLYFALAPLLSRIRFLRASLVVVLGFVGVKMLLTHIQPIPIGISLAVIATILAVGGLASALLPGPDKAPLRSPLHGEREGLAHVTVAVAVRCVALVAGSTLLALGGAWLFLPGPGALTILAGLVLLATQGLWARRLLDRARGGRS